VVVQNNAIYVILTRVGYILLIAIVLSVLANVLVYFSQSKGAYLDFGSPISHNLDYHTPVVNWSQPSVPKGRLLEQFDQEKITKAYQNAWYFLNESLRNKSAVGLEDVFSDHLVDEIIATINNENSFSEDRVDLSHNLDLHIFSIDKQVIAFRDSNVRIKRKVKNGDAIIYEEEVYKSYEVVMTLSDGKWRVLHLKEVENYKPKQKIKPTSHFVMDSIVTFVEGSRETSSLKPMVNCKVAAKDGFHKLKKGETLYRLSRKYNASVKQIMKWNKFKDISDINICSHIRVKAPETKRRKIVLVSPSVQKNEPKKNIVVKKNESVFSIAKKLKISASLLKEYNNLDSYELREDQVIKIPNELDANIAALKNIKGINYYPQDTPWWDFWVEFDSKIIRKDLLAIKQLKMNTVRVFVPSDGVIPGLQFGVMLDKLEKLMDECSQLDLQVMITLFDFPVSFDLDYYTKSETQLKGLMDRFKDHPALLGWDLKNEPDLDFKIHGKKKVLQWLEYLIERGRVFDPNHILTIGWSSPEAAVNLADKLDLISYHYYRDPTSLKLDMLKLKRAVDNKPLLLQEFGLPSNRKWYKPLAYSEEDQAAYLAEFKKEMEENDLPYLLWTLYDFTDIPTQVFGYKKWANSKQKYFGLIDKNGKKKPSYYIFSNKRQSTK
jgi:LysM repeat protein